MTSRLQIDRIGFADDINIPELRGIIGEVFQTRQSRRGSNEKMQPYLFQKVWIELGEPVQRGRDIDEKIIRMTATGRVVLVGILDNFEKQNVLVLLRKKAKEDGFGIETRGILSQRPNALARHINRSEIVAMRMKVERN